MAWKNQWHKYIHIQILMISRIRSFHHGTAPAPASVWYYNVRRLTDGMRVTSIAFCFPIICYSVPVSPANRKDATLCMT